jgi:hypothetical protein
MAPNTPPYPKNTLNQFGTKLVKGKIQLKVA